MFIASCVFKCKWTICNNWQAKYEEIKFTPDNILITKQINTVMPCDKNILRLNAQLCG